MCAILDGERWVEDILAVMGNAGMSFDILPEFLHYLPVKPFAIPLNFGHHLKFILCTTTQMNSLIKTLPC